MNNYTKFSIVVTLACVFFNCNNNSKEINITNFQTSLDVVSRTYGVNAKGRIVNNILSTENVNNSFIVTIEDINENILKNNSQSDISSIVTLLVVNNLKDSEFSKNDEIKVVFKGENTNEFKFDYQYANWIKSCYLLSNKFVGNLANQSSNKNLNLMDLEIMGISDTAIVKILKEFELLKYGKLNTFKVGGFEKGEEKGIEFLKVKIGFNYANSKHIGYLVFNKANKIIGLNL